MADPPTISHAEAVQKIVASYGYDTPAGRRTRQLHARRGTE